MPSSRLQLGPVLDLPLDIITMRSLVLGVSGSGKSTFGRLLCEQVHAAGQRFCVIDLKNDWWGLKSSADGKHAAIPVVIVGGPRADIPLDEKAGAAVADIVAETPHSFVLDLDQLSKRKGILFLGAFLERLYDVNREPLLLVCDEADRYAPQKPMSVEANETLGAADDIARRGRKRGIGSLWLSQRPAVIAKNVTSQCELVVTFRTTSSLDLKELKEHIGRVASAEQVAETMRLVAGLPDGQAILMSQHPLLKLFKVAQFPMPATFDSSATPRVGQRRAEPKHLAAPDLAALGERIQAAAEKAQASDPKYLQARVRELEAKLRAAEQRKPELQRVEVSVLTESDHQRLENVARIWKEAGAQLAAASENLNEKLATGLRNGFCRPIGMTAAAPDMRPVIAQRQSPLVPQQLRGSKYQGYGKELTRAERKILTALAQYPEGRTKSQVAILTGYAVNGGGFGNALSALRTREWLEGQGDNLRITPAGEAALGPYTPLPAGQELLQHWLGQLGKAEREALQVLVDAYPDAITKEEVAARTASKYSADGGGFGNALSRLRTLELITGRGELRASEELF
jgi:hypothetical protein